MINQSYPSQNYLKENWRKYLKMDKNKIEIRSSEFKQDGRVIEGYQIVFNSLSENLGGFREIILPEQINMEICNRCDVFATLDHDRSRPLQRRRNGQGSLDLSIDEHGLKYRFELANTQVANELYEYIQRGELDQSSFQFTTDNDEWLEEKDGTWKRTIKSIDYLYDVSQVFQPAYSLSSVGLRSLEDAKSKSNELREAQEKAKQDKRQKELDKYYSKLTQRIVSL